MRARALVLALLALPLGGCFSSSEGPRLASPTTDPVVPPPTPTSPTKAYTPPDFSDPGYVTNATWHVGDAWDYYGDLGHYRAVRVVAMAQKGNDTFFQTRESEGTQGNAPNSRYSRWINASSWTVVNRTDERGLGTTYAPPAPERFLRNGSYRYNFTVAGQTTQVYANVLYTGRPVVTLPWGEVVKGARFEHRTLTIDPHNAQQRIFIVRVFAQEWGNELSYQLGEDAEVFSLHAARYGARQQGELVPS